MLEMVEDELETFWRDEYLEVTAGVAVVPFSFGSFPVLFGKARNLTGLVIYDEIQKYLQESPKDNFWPCWEMNDHDIVRGKNHIILEMYENGILELKYSFN